MALCARATSITSAVEDHISYASVPKLPPGWRECMQKGVSSSIYCIKVWTYVALLDLWLVADARLFQEGTVSGSYIGLGA
jgi:hypothetical protein